MTKLTRWIFTRLLRARDLLDSIIHRFDICELCKESETNGLCINCDRYICWNCDSGYYNDVELCNDCRKEITPEDELRDLAEQKAYEKKAFIEDQP